MMNKSTLIALLVCINLVLLTGLILATYSAPAALAQGTGLAGNYILVSGEIQNPYDALYLLDLKTRMLHAFKWDRSTKRLEYRDVRDLERDFRNKD